MILLGAGAAVLAVAGMRAAAGIIAPTFLALVLTIALHPISGYLGRRRSPVWVSTLATILASYALLLGLAVALVFAAARFATLLPQYEDQFNDLVKSAANTLKDHGVGQPQINRITQSFDPGRLVAAVGSLLAGLLGVVSNLFFVVTLLLFLGIDASRFPLQLEEQRKQRGALVEALQSFAHGTRRYLVVSTIFGLLVAVLDTVFLQLTPVPAPLLWGLLAFITNYIPNIGFVIGLVPPATLGLLEGGPGLMLLIIGVYTVLNFVIQSVVQPRFVGDAVGLSGSITFLSLMFWAWVLGPVGALFAIPLTLLVKAVLVDADRDSSWLKPLLAGTGPAVGTSLEGNVKAASDTAPTTMARTSDPASEVPLHQTDPGGSTPQGPERRPRPDGAG